MHFLNMWLSGIVAITNSNGDTTSPWNICTTLDFHLNKLFPLALHSTLQFFIVSSIHFMTFQAVLYILSQSIIQVCETTCLFVVNLRHLHFLSHFALLREFVCQCPVDLLFQLFLSGILSVLRGTVRGFANSKHPSEFVLFVCSTLSEGTLCVYSCWEWFLFGGLFWTE